jgi:hypothetical protein
MSCHKLCRGCWVSQPGSDPSSCIRASPECRSDKGSPACTPGSTEPGSYRSSPPSPLRSSRGPSHRATAPSCPSVLLALAAWPLSGSLYMILITLTFYQWCFVPVTGADLTEPWWINMDGHYHVRRRPSHSGRARPGGLAGGPPTRAADPDYRVLSRGDILDSSARGDLHREARHHRWSGPLHGGRMVRRLSTGNVLCGQLHLRRRRPLSHSRQCGPDYRSTRL